MKQTPKHRFFAPIDLRKKVLRVSDGGLINQWRNVLRLKNGKEITLFDGKGGEARAKILRLDSGFAELEALGFLENNNEPENRVVLCCSVLKRENFELAAQKTTEVGVCEIAPIIAERTEKLKLRLDRLEKLIKEAAEQLGRAIIPAIREPAKFEEAAVSDLARGSSRNFIFDLSGDKFGDLRFAPGDKRITVWVGPEGGWAEGELALAEKAGFRKVSLGPLTLRAETAAIVASHLAVNVPSSQDAGVLR